MENVPIRRYVVELINPDTGLVCYATSLDCLSFSLTPDKAYSFYTALHLVYSLKLIYPLVSVVAYRD